MGRYVIPYTADGYLDMAAILKRDSRPFLWFIGGRGCGKTYGAIDYLLHVKRKPFLLMRRTNIQQRAVSSPVSTPLAVNLREGQEIIKVRTDTDALSRLDVLQDGEYYNTIYTTGLSVVSSLRGIDLTFIEDVVFDEFIKEPHDRPITEEYDAFKNAYETIARNRELQGRPPLRVIALANALDIGNPYFRGMGIVNQVYQMTGDLWADDRRGIAVYRPLSRDFLLKKKSTALYMLDDTGSTIGRDFGEVDTTYIKSLDTRQARPICNIDGVGFWLLHGSVYASVANVPDPSFMTSDPVDRRTIHQKYQRVVTAMFRRRVTFESVDIKLRCDEIAQKL